MKRSDLVWRLLRKNISVSQIAGYAVANMVGLSIVLCALQFLKDTRSAAQSDDDSLIGRDYIIVSKTVSETGALFGQSTVFTSEEIADIAAQPWVAKVGRFTPADFNVAAAVEMGGRGMSTELFFESIPDEFFDVRPEGWDFDPSDQHAKVPIVISKDYLALYNFGFAASRGLPQVSERTVKSIPLTVSVAGNGRQRRMGARVVGFSSRLNTIAVPESFMAWANHTFGESDGDPDVSRLIIEVTDPGNPAIEAYLSDHGIDTAGDNTARSRAAYFLSIASTVVMVIGLVISLLSIMILMLSIFLLLQKNRDKIHDLMMLGYTPNQVALPYYRLVAAVNFAIFVVAVAVMLCAAAVWRVPFAQLGLLTASPWVSIITGLNIIIAVTLINFVAIKRIVGRNFR